MGFQEISLEVLRRAFGESHGEAPCVEILSGLRGVGLVGGVVVEAALQHEPAATGHAARAGAGRYPA